MYNNTHAGIYKHLQRNLHFVIFTLFLVLPEDGPTISGVKPQYQVGDDVNVTCSAGPSKPAASLRWYINGHEVSKYLFTV